MHCLKMLRFKCRWVAAPKLPMVFISTMPIAAPGPCRKVAGQMATTAHSPVRNSESGQGIPDALAHLS